MTQQEEPWLFSAIRNFHQRHERLKHTVHTAWRYPLPRWGRVIMGCVYFSIPVVGGYQIMQWAISKSHESIGKRGEFLPKKEIQGIGDKRILEDGTEEKVGAGGVGGGVRLAVSDPKTQTQNRQMLEAFFRQQRRKEKQRKAKEQQQQAAASNDSMVETSTANAET